MAEESRLVSRQAELTSLLKARASGIASELAQWEAALTPEQMRKRAGRIGGSFPAGGNRGHDRREYRRAGSHRILQGKFASAEGRIGRALDFDGSTFIAAGETGAFDSDQACSFAAWIFHEQRSEHRALQNG